MPLDCSIDRADHVESAPRGAAVFDVPGFDVEREELCAETALLHARDARAIWRWRSAAQIVIVVGHRSGYVVMCVDDDGAAVDCERTLPEAFVALLGEGGGYEQQKQSN